MVNEELCYTSAVDAIAGFKARRLSPVELMEAIIARAEKVNSKINAFTFQFFDEALEQARKAEAKYVKTGGRPRPLEGLPTAIKDLTPTKGKTTTLGGSYEHENWVPEESATVVQRLEAAGAIVVGKTTSPELGYSGFTQSKMWGVTRNPWNLERTPGGSSGGAAAAVASGCIPFAEGSDGGGSVRVPASFCGLVGLKPTVGRIPFKIRSTAFETFVHHGPLARTIDDAALFLKVTHGPDDQDYLSIGTTIEVPVPVPHDISGLRLALSVDFGCYALDPEVERNTRAAATALAAAGAVVEEVDLDWPASMLAAFYTYWDSMYAADYVDKVEEWGERMDPLIVAAVERGRNISAIELKEVDRVRTEMWRKLVPVLERYHALLCPTVSVPPPRVELSDPDVDFRDNAGRLHGFMAYPFNMLSQCPALNVPSGFTTDGLPIGLQIVGRRFDDIGVLKAGAALEKVRPWADKRPDV